MQTASHTCLTQCRMVLIDAQMEFNNAHRASTYKNALSALKRESYPS